MKGTAALLVLLSLGLPASTQNGGVNRLSPLERDAGWRLLFDGQTTSGWRSVGGVRFPAEGWEVQDGALHHTSGGGDIVTEQSFAEFELEFEWKVAPGANSGVKYMLAPGDAARAFGPEYQVLDDGAHPDALLPAHRASALYDLFPAQGARLEAVGQYNRGRILVREGHIEHWLNGVRTVNVDTASEAWARAHAASKYADTPDFARRAGGRIALQDHGDEVWFRSLRIRELPAADFEEVDLLPGEALEGWHDYGDARYTREGRTILGETDGGGQSFLLSKPTFGDFLFEVDVKTEQRGNSGIQIRCHQRENGRPFGYQIEIDPSPRAWTGGLYDEDRRAWLQNLEGNDAARGAFVYGEWNRFRIECIGPWIRASVNGVPTVDYFDLADLEGSFGLQVHSGNNTRLRWREPRVWDLGERSWKQGRLSGTETQGVSIEVSEGIAIISSDRAEARVMLPGSHEPWGVSMRFSLSSPNAVTLRCGEWSHSLASHETFSNEDWNEVGLCRDGERVTVLLNGKPVESSLSSELGGQGFSLSFEGREPANRLRGLEVLGPSER